MRRPLIGLDPNSEQARVCVSQKFSFLGKTGLSLLLASAFLSEAPPASAQLIKAPAYKDLDGVSKTFLLIDSKWGYISPFNIALASELRSCTKPSATAEEASDLEGTSDLPELLELSPNRFGVAAVAAIDALRKCEGLPATDTVIEKQVNEADWRRLLPETPLPSVYARARTIAFRGAGRTSDYDGIVVGSSSRAVSIVAEPALSATASATPVPAIVLTWGPALAQTIEGCYVQRILARYYQTDGGAERYKTIFTDEAALGELLRAPCDPTNRDQLSAALQAADEKGVLKGLFADLATDAALRRAYDDAYLSESGPWKSRLTSFYKLYREAGYTPTEIDFAYFLDMARGVIPDKKIDQALRQKFSTQGKGTASQRRRVLFDLLSFQIPEQKRFLLGRSVSYWIDDVSETGLSLEERTAWLTHSRVRASDVGLTDQTFYPCEILPSLNECKDRRS